MQTNGNPYAPVKTEVLDIVQETPTINTLRLKPEGGLDFETGQFIELTVPGIGEAPFTPSSQPAISDVIEVTVMRVGKVTDKVHELLPGSIVGLRGPFGNGYPMNDFLGQEILVVGGGCGFAPLRSLMYEFFSRTDEFKALHFRGGCKSPSEFLFRNEIEEWTRRTDLDIELTVDVGDDSWNGSVGVVTTILNGIEVDTAHAIAIVCGPPIMMKFATARVLELGYQEDRVYLSMEKNMSCGFGKCGHCRLGPFYTCKDGPVFRYDRIKNIPGIWE